MYYVNLAIVLSGVFGVQYHDVEEIQRQFSSNCSIFCAMENKVAAMLTMIMGWLAMLHVSI